jgi:hypothetical protein
MNTLVAVAIFIGLLVVGLVFSRGSISGFQSDQAEMRFIGEQPGSAREGYSDFVEVKGVPETDIVDGPAEATLDTPRVPYHLLNGVLKNAPADTIGSLNAVCCYETDFESRTNLTGNYIQRTNNYKRSYPDNCSTPLHELTMSFYKPTPLKQQIM